MAIYEVNLGPDHPETADAYSKIGLAYKECAQYKTAAPWLRRAFCIFYRSFGAEEGVTRGTYE